MFVTVQGLRGNMLRTVLCTVYVSCPDNHFSAFFLRPIFGYWIQLLLTFLNPRWTATGFAFCAVSSSWQTCAYCSKTDCTVPFFSLVSWSNFPFNKFSYRALFLLSFPCQFLWCGSDFFPVLIMSTGDSEISSATPRTVALGRSVLHCWSSQALRRHSCLSLYSLWPSSDVTSEG